MNCADFQARLIESLYGELPDEEETRLQEHSAACDSCRQEMETLRQTRRELKKPAEPKSTVDLGRLYRAAAARSLRGRRRWRRLGVAACAATVLAAAFTAAGLRLEWRPGRLVVSWGDDLPETQSVAPEMADASPVALRRHEERLDTLEEVARLLSNELSRSDDRHQAAFAALHRELAQGQRDTGVLARQMNARWRVASQDIRDIYLTQVRFDSDQKGAMP